MNCPVCNHSDTRVVDSRLSAEGDAIRRRRECDACQHRFSTLEEVLMLDLFVVKRDGARQSYDEDKMVAGLRKALEKRPVTDASFRSLVRAIERDVQRLGANEVTSEEIGSIVMRHLQSFDEVAYIRFASVYRKFEDVETFQRELQSLMSLPEETPRPRKNAKR